MGSRGKRRGPGRRGGGSGPGETTDDAGPESPAQRRRRRRRERRPRAGGGSGRGRGFALFALLIALTLAMVYTRDLPALRYSLLGVALVVFVVLNRLPFMRKAMADHWTASIGRWLGRIARLDGLTLLVTIAAAGLAYAAGNGLRDAAFPDEDGVRAYLVATFGVGGTQPVPGGGNARVHRSADPPTVTAARIDAAHPADDQRYTPAGVVLRYDRDIVAVLPSDKAATSTILVEAARTGHRHFARLLGDFWGPRYDGPANAPASALAVPDAEDTAELGRVLSRAAAEQSRPGDRVCYGWEIQIRSGRRKGAWTGSSRPGDAPYFAGDACDSYVALTGWIDPNAGRLNSRGDDPGAFDLGYDVQLAEDLPPSAFRRADVPPKEILEPDRAGKGVLELAGIMPLLAAETGALTPVAFDARPVERPAPLAPTEQSDASRRAADGGAVGEAANVLIGGGAFVGLLTLVVAAGGLAVRGGRHVLARVR